MMMQLFSLLVFVSCMYSSNAFKLSMKSSQPNLQQSMMKKFSGIICASCILVSSVGGMVGPASAAVGEGDLPPGSMAFQKLLKYQVRKAFVELTSKRFGLSMTDQDLSQQPFVSKCIFRRSDSSNTSILLVE